MGRFSIHDWARLVGDTTSIHGLPWYNFFHQPCLKHVISVLLLGIFITLPIFLTLESMEFLNCPKIRTTTELKAFPKLPLPNLTVCHPFPFNRHRIRETFLRQGLTEEAKKTDTEIDSFASYLTFAFDHSKALNFAPRFQWVQEYCPDCDPNVYPVDNSEVETQFNGNKDKYSKDVRRYREFMDQDAIFQKYSERSGENIIALLESVSQRCDEIVKMCTLGAFANIIENCCDLFGDDPVFSAQGICFTTTSRHLIDFTGGSDPILFTFESSPQNASEPSSALDGLMGIRYQSMTFGMGENQTVVSVLDQRMQKAPRNKVIEVGITILKNDLTQMKDRFLAPSNLQCISMDDAEFYTQFGINYTQIDCFYLSLNVLIPNCTMATFRGYKGMGNLPPCVPVQVMKNLRSSNTWPDVWDRKCLKDCQTTLVVLESSVGDINQRILEQNTGHFRSPVILEMHFTSLEITTSTLSMESIGDFLSKVGGWMGLATGASLITILELIAYLIYLVWGLVYRQIGWLWN